MVPRVVNEESLGVVRHLPQIQCQGKETGNAKRSRVQIASTCKVERSTVGNVETAAQCHGSWRPTLHTFYREYLKATGSVETRSAQIKDTLGECDGFVCRYSEGQRVFTANG